MHSRVILCLASMQALLGSAFGSPARFAKRAAETNATLYAYGTNTSSWPIAIGVDDGNLYVTQTPNDSANNLTPITWDLPSITADNWIVNGTYDNGTSAGSLTLKPSQDYAVGVMDLDATMMNQTNSTLVTGFALLATQLVWNNDTKLEAQFWAASTGTDGIYSLKWLIDDATPVTGSFPVVVKASEGS